MRLLQLNTNGNDASALDFHPMVTVVHGLTRRMRPGVRRSPAPARYTGVATASWRRTASSTSTRPPWPCSLHRPRRAHPASDIPGAAPVPRHWGQRAAAVEPLSVEAFSPSRPRPLSRARRGGPAARSAEPRPAAGRRRPATHREAIEKRTPPRPRRFGLQRREPACLVVDEVEDDDAPMNRRRRRRRHLRHRRRPARPRRRWRPPDDDVGPTDSTTGTDDADAHPLVGTLLRPEAVETVPPRPTARASAPRLRLPISRPWSIASSHRQAPPPTQVRSRCSSAIRSPARSSRPVRRSAELADEFVRLQAE
jgi:hypothetical protein